MSAEPPSSGRPTGPPSGPLSGPSQPGSSQAGPSESGPSQPPSGPPSQPPGGSSGGTPPGGTPEPRRPWWHSASWVALLTTAVVAAVAVALLLTRGDGGSNGNGEVFLQAADKTGPDPFTESTATDSSAPPTSVPPASTPGATNALRGVDGGAAGLYGGTRKVTSCDVEQQIRFLAATPAKNKTFAVVAGVQPPAVPAYLRSLTPVQLRMDTRVTNHGYRDGAATSYQAVLQTGTAVLVDARGVPRVRCACGNPLTPPVAVRGTPKATGDSWASYRPSNVVVVAPSTVIIDVFVLYDPEDDQWFARHRGDAGDKDHRTSPPVSPLNPSASASSPSPSTPSSPSTPATPSSPSSPGSSSPSTSPSSPSPSSEPPSPEPDTSVSSPGPGGSPASSSAESLAVETAVPPSP